MDEGVLMTAELRLFMGGYDDSDSQERRRLGGDLANALEAVAEVRPREGVAPAPAKSAGAIEWAELVVTLVGTLPVVMQTIQSWLGRRGGLSPDRRASVTVKIGEDEITVNSEWNAEQQELVRAFLERHAAD